MRSRVLLLLVLLTTPYLYGKPIRRDERASKIYELTGAPARFVWAQGVKDPKDYTVQKESARLMGFDTEDGKGERAIVDKVWGYSKPIFTPDGQRIVFSNRVTGKVYVVNWDGSGLRELVAGLATDVWIDPQTRIEWLYVRSGDGATNKPIIRYRMDQPSVSEVVWKQTKTGHPSLTWFRLSADGKRAAGTFPWNDCGVATLPDGGWKKYGQACCSGSWVARRKGVGLIDRFPRVLACIACDLQRARVEFLLGARWTGAGRRLVFP